jgi:hypothetical protein
MIACFDKHGELLKAVLRLHYTTEHYRVCPLVRAIVWHPGRSIIETLYQQERSN